MIAEISKIEDKEPLTVLDYEQILMEGNILTCYDGPMYSDLAETYILGGGYRVVFSEGLKH